MTYSEKVEMYQMIEKDKLIEMLIEANNVINRLTEAKNLRIADAGSFLSARSKFRNRIVRHIEYNWLYYLAFCFGSICATIVEKIVRAIASLMQ